MVHLKKLFWQLSLVVLVSAVLAGPAWAMPPLPASFYGTVKVDGENVSAGTKVSAWINGVKYAETTVQFYAGDSVYSLNVAGDDPATLGVIEGGVPGDTVVFHIGEGVTLQTSHWTNGSNREFNLTRAGKPVTGSVRVFIPLVLGRR